MDPIKDAFSRVRQDIDYLKFELYNLKEEIHEIKRTQTQHSDRQTDRQINQTQHKNQTDNKPLETPYSKNIDISTGNRGVQTDRQTDRQTDKSSQKFAQASNLQQIPSLKLPQTPQKRTIDNIEKVSQVLDSLDEIKKELRQKFKHLTNKEMLIFSTIYQLEDQGITPDYAVLSSRLNISQSSIRDHVKNLIQKGIPISKQRQDNKKITLFIVEDFKKIASLQTILALRKL